MTTGRKDETDDEKFDAEQADTDADSPEPESDAQPDHTDWKSDSSAPSKDDADLDELFQVDSSIPLVVPETRKDKEKSLKKTTHILALEGLFKIDGERVRGGGSSEEVVVSDIRDSFDLICRKFEDSESASKLKDAFQLIIDTGADFSKLKEAFSRREPVVLMSGWGLDSESSGIEHHSIGLYASIIEDPKTHTQKLLLMHCNRGAGINLRPDFPGEDGTSIYIGDINAKDPFAALSRLINRHHPYSYNFNSGEEFYKAFNSVLKEAKCQQVGFIPLSHQSAGTCTYANKTGLLSGLEAFHGEKKVSDPKIIFSPEEFARKKDARLLLEECRANWQKSPARQSCKEMIRHTKTNEIERLCHKVKEQKGDPRQSVEYQLLIEYIRSKTALALILNLPIKINYINKIITDLCKDRDESTKQAIEGDIVKAIDSSLYNKIRIEINIASKGKYDENEVKKRKDELLSNPNLPLPESIKTKLTEKTRSEIKLR